MNKNYKTPMISIIQLSFEDIITESSFGNVNDGAIQTPWDPIEFEW